LFLSSVLPMEINNFSSAYNNMWRRYINAFKT
jgi:hypothetical protein